MAIIIFLIGFACLAFMFSTVKLISCWAVRKLLGIPKYPPYHEAEVPPLPYYLDDRQPPPN